MSNVNIESLNTPQKEAVLHTEGPLLIVAGAGTGKTTVITNRVAHIIDQGLAKADEILCLTFTDKAAGEMEERIDRLLPYGYVDLWVMTFHSFCERILKQYGVEIGLPADFKILDQTSQYMLVQKEFNRFNLDYYRPLGKPTKFIPAMLTHFSRAKDEGVTPDQYLDYVEGLNLDKDNAEYTHYGELAHAYHTYQQILLENDALDFGDLIMYTKKLLQERPNVLDKLRKQFKYILVDEFQDTNWAQYDLVKLLGAPNNNITVVGDDDQSIYKFRGASLSNILGFKKDYPKAKQVVLNTNYRSMQNILDLSYQFIQYNNPNRLEFADIEPIDKKLQAGKDGKGVVEYLHYHSLEDEATGVVQKIIDLRKTDPECNFGDFAILVRANNHAEQFLQKLSLAEIPYQFMASQGLFSQTVVLDILSYFKIIDQYAESKNLYRILILPTIDLSNDDLMKLLEHARKKAISLHETLKQASNLELSEVGVSKCQMILESIDEHAKLARTARVSEVAMAFLDKFGLKEYFEKLSPQRQRDTYQLLNHFWKIMQNFEAEQDDKTVKPFLDYLDLMQQAGDSGSLPQDLEAGPDTVKVMTMHGSKGLEFKYVFVVNLVDRRFPSSMRKDPLPLPEDLIKELHNEDEKMAHVEEERRLCYVALTRAKLGLFLTSALDYGGARRKKPSQFLYELGFEIQDPKPQIQQSIFDDVFEKTEYQKSESLDYAKYIPKTFSFSQLKAFETCPWQYRYAYIMKIPVRGRFTFSFGKSMHNTLEKFFLIIKERQVSSQQDLFGGGKADSKGKVEASLDELLEIYEQEWIDEWYQSPAQKEQYYKQGKETLRKYFEKFEGEWPQVFDVEKAFHLKVGKYTLKGMIDRIDKGEKGLKIIDYKTGSVPKSIDKDQLILYQIAAEQVLKEEVEDLSFYYLNESEEVSFLADDKKKEKLEEKIEKTIDKIHEAKFDPKPSQQVCKNCDFQDICPYRII